jgi:hypothetical protein
MGVFESCSSRQLTCQAASPAAGIRNWTPEQAACARHVSQDTKQTGPMCFILSFDKVLFFV